MSWHGIIGNALSVAIFALCMALYIKDRSSSNESRVAYWTISTIAACALVAAIMFAGTAMLTGAKEVWPYIPTWR